MRRSGNRAWLGLVGLAAVAALTAATAPARGADDYKALTNAAVSGLSKAVDSVVDTDPVIVAPPVEKDSEMTVQAAYDVVPARVRGSLVYSYGKGTEKAGVKAFMLGRTMDERPVPALPDRGGDDGVAAKGWVRESVGILKQLLAGVAELDPVFDAPPKPEGEVLSITGVYQTKPLPLRFHVTFNRKDGKWVEENTSVSLFRAAAPPAKPE